jgi:hypothetical protein
VPNKQRELDRDYWERRQAMQIVEQLAGDPDEARRVLHHALRLIDEFLDVHDDQKTRTLALVRSGALLIFFAFSGSQLAHSLDNTKWHRPPIIEIDEVEGRAGFPDDLDRLL